VGTINARSRCGIADEKKVMQRAGGEKVIAQMNQSKNLERMGDATGLTKNGSEKLTSRDSSHRSILMNKSEKRGSQIHAGEAKTDPKS